MAKHTVASQVRRSIQFFWGPEDRTLHEYRWGMRGMAFVNGGCQLNVHWRDLIGGTGHNMRVRLFWLRTSWYRLLFSGWVFLLMGKVR